MSKQTITEALAEIKTISKRVEKKREHVLELLVRPDRLKDPMESDGGSRSFIAKELQAIGDLSERLVQLRAAIAASNLATPVTVAGQARTVSEWLTWRREIAPGLVEFYSRVRGRIQGARQEASRQGYTTTDDPQSAADVIVNISEAELARTLDELEDLFGQLDGALSLKNATTTV